MVFRIVFPALLVVLSAFGSQSGNAEDPAATDKTATDKAVSAKAPAQAPVSADYVLGPEDQIHIHVVDMEDIPDKPIRIDPNGNIDLPLLGPIHASGMTAGQLRATVMDGLKRFVRSPMVSVSVVEFHSKPITVLGAVNNPGVHQVEGPRTLLEALSMAGGVRPDAGSTLTLTRKSESGPIPLQDARKSLDGKFSVATLDIDRLMAMKDPANNITVLPNDVISVSTAALIWVMGEVKKPGGFTLHSHEKISALQALAMAEGPQKTAAPKRASISREQEPGKPRVYLQADLSAIMQGKAPDVPLQANDILMSPNNEARNAALRAMELAIQIGTGVVIFRR